MPCGDTPAVVGGQRHQPAASDQVLAVGLLVGTGVFAAVGAVQFLRDLLAHAAPRRRRPWDIPD